MPASTQATAPTTRATVSRAFHYALLMGVHLTCLLAWTTGVSAEVLVLCGVLYVARMFGVTAGYHRYFSHRSYKTSRAFQLLLALLAMSSGQRGVLWWAWCIRPEVLSQISRSTNAVRAERTGR
jgi:stearoyl-CoA desaturase (delta-9 desaturase)